MSPYTRGPSPSTAFLKISLSKETKKNHFNLDLSPYSSRASVWRRGGECHGTVSPTAGGCTVVWHRAGSAPGPEGRGYCMDHHHSRWRPQSTQRRARGSPGGGGARTNRLLSAPRLPRMTGSPGPHPPRPRCAPASQHNTKLTLVTSHGLLPLSLPKLPRSEDLLGQLLKGAP